MIQMIAGVYGLQEKQANGKTRVIAKGPNDGPFSTSPEQEARLVKMKLAVYVGQPKDEAEDEQTEDNAEGYPIGFDETPPDDFGDDSEPADDSDEAEEAEVIVDLASLTAKELREIGKEYGLTFKANAKKDEMVAAITAAQEETIEDDAEDDAPAFDAAEAVL